MKWAVVGKGDIPHVAKEAEGLIEILEGLDQDVFVSDDLGAEINRPGRPMDELHEVADIFLTVGGDGTILHAMTFTDKPVFGVNAGAIGFLAEIEPPQAEWAIKEIIAGQYTLEERYRLAVELDGEEITEAVNEVTLQTSRIAKLIRFTVTVDDEILDTFRGDGIIVSTPTGSTGYAMSVGGPLVHPRVPGIVLAPIAPFRLSARPWVVPSDATIVLTLLARDSAQGVQQAKVVVDGQEGFDVDTGASVVIHASKRKARFIRLSSGFYERVRTKLTR